MKFLFDFDGVLTEQSEEADRVLEIFRERLSERAGLSTHAAADTVDEAQRALRAEPWRYGWMSQGRVSAFADEDLFIRNNGVAGWLDGRADSGDAVLSAARDRLAAGGTANFTDLCRKSYDTMAAETQNGARHPVDAGTLPLLSRLIEAGHSLVVVSNSGTARILSMLREVGLPAVEHVAASTEALRVRGGARKYDLDADRTGSSGFRVGAYQVETRRPIYDAIVREERPDFVIGDVLSLDLALPISLTRSGALKARVLLRVREYTPAWSRGYIEKEVEGARAITSLAQINDMVETST